MPTIAEAFPAAAVVRAPVVHLIREQTNRDGHLTRMMKCGVVDPERWTAWSQEITCAECQGHGTVST